MSKYIYIQKDAANIYVTMPEKLDTANNDIGTTWEDYVAGKYVLLTEEQIAFKEANEGASVEEVFNMQLTPIPEPTPEEKLQTAKDLKRQEVYNTDYRHYYIDDNDVYTYDRLSLKDQCARKDTVEVNGKSYKSSLLLEALNEMADYNDICIGLSEKFLSDIEAAETVEDVEVIEVTGYPEVIRTTTAALQTKVDKAIAKSPEAQVVTFARATMNSVSLTASQALEMQVLFPIWGEKDAEFGKEVEIGFRLRVVEGESDTLFEVIQKHKLQADWKPGIETASLYKIVEAEHAGTLDDPIPYVQGMAFKKDKYYEQYGVIYLCILTTVTGYPNDLKDLPTIVQKIK